MLRLLDYFIWAHIFKLFLSLAFKYKWFKSIKIYPNLYITLWLFYLKRILNLKQKVKLTFDYKINHKKIIWFKNIVFFKNFTLLNNWWLKNV